MIVYTACLEEFYMRGWGNSGTLMSHCQVGRHVSDALRELRTTRTRGIQCEQSVKKVMRFKTSNLGEPEWILRYDAQKWVTYRHEADQLC